MTDVSSIAEKTVYVFNHAHYDTFKDAARARLKYAFRLFDDQNDEDVDVRSHSVRVVEERFRELITAMTTYRDAT